jgi:hypothetical protein
VHDTCITCFRGIAFLLGAKTVMRVTLNIIHLLCARSFPVLAILRSSEGIYERSLATLKSNVQYCSFHRLQLTLLCPSSCYPCITLSIPFVDKYGMYPKREFNHALFVEHVPCRYDKERGREREGERKLRA